MKKNLRYIFLFFSVSLIITVVIFTLFFKNLSSLKSYNESIEHTHQVLDKIQNVQYLLTEAENSQRGFVITKDTAFKQTLQQIQKIIYPEVQELRSLVENNQRQLQLLIKLNNDIVDRIRVLNETVEAAGSSRQEVFNKNNIIGRKIMSDFNYLAKEMEEEELRILAEKKQQKDNYERASPRYLMFILIASVIFQILSLIVITKEFRSRFTYQRKLERNINELNMSHAELEQIAFIASHDLQEPLRKMRTFSSKLLSLFKDRIDNEGTIILNKIDSNATRMQGLIQDLVDYTNLINSQEKLQDVDLNICLNDVQANLTKAITTKHAAIKISELPKIAGFPFQLQLLFTNLIHNAIKFSREGIDPEITITGEKILAYNPYIVSKQLIEEPYLLIKVKDNGIGFENEFAKKIFEMFQRLHTQQSSYEGKGIGLSICKRVMSNHNGFISAEGEPGNGAIFNLYFPI